MPNSMMVNLFQVHHLVDDEPLENTLNAIKRMRIADRIKLVGQRDMRLESYAAPRTRDNETDYWLLDFTKLRFDNGPGKISREQPIEGFVLGEDEGFGEETGALYDPTTRHILLQYNHHGPRSASIQEYLSIVSPDITRTYEFWVQMDQTAEARLAQRQIIKKLHFKIAPPKLTPEMRRTGVSLERALELNDMVQGDTIEVILSAGRGRLANQNIHRAIDSLKRLLRLDQEGDHDAVKTLRVHAKEHIDADTDEINLIAPKLEQEIAGLVLGPDLRYTRKSRWEALIRARNGWANLL